MQTRREFLGAFAAAGAIGPRLVFGAPPAGPRPDTGPTDVSDLLAPIIKKHDVPGMSACLVQAGRGVRLIGAAGVRRRGDDAAFTSSDLVHIGSCGKAMTATLCGVLVEAGSLRWDLTLPEALPELQDKVHQAYRPVTLRQLLCHTAGVPNNLGETGMLNRVRAFRGSATDARTMLAAELLGAEPSQDASPPGSKYLYSNAGYVIAGLIAETAAGKPYEDLIRERVFNPIGITTAGFGAPGVRGTLDQPRGHRASGDPVEPGPNGAGDNPLPMAPAGTIHMSIADWGKFVEQHLDAPQTVPASPRLLRAETLAELHRSDPVSKPSYACGWGVTERPWAGDRGKQGVALTHGGSNTLWHAVVWAAPRKGFAMLAATNYGGDRAVKANDEAVGALLRAHTKG